MQEIGRKNFGLFFVRTKPLYDTFNQSIEVSEHIDIHLKS